MSLVLKSYLLGL